MKDAEKVTNRTKGKIDKKANKNEVSHMHKQKRRL